MKAMQVVTMRTTMIPSTLERKITLQMMSFLLLSITREQVERPTATHPGSFKRKTIRNWVINHFILNTFNHGKQGRNVIINKPRWLFDWTSVEWAMTIIIITRNKNSIVHYKVHGRGGVIRKKYICIYIYKFIFKEWSWQRMTLIMKYPVKGYH